MPQERIPDKFTVLEEAKPHVFLIFFNNPSITMNACYLYDMNENRKI